ncbi:MAG TPA: Rnf-Nqr domain containing protein, partial [Spirochaetia bacterium]|nr:Rnf-Nqr domain containing protein [Spirochaetia bacterium]
MNLTPVWVVLLGSIFTNNILFASFLGMCSFLVCSNRISTAIGLGSAVTFVMFFTTVINYLIYRYVLVP